MDFFINDIPFSGYKEIDFVADTITIERLGYLMLRHYHKDIHEGDYVTIEIVSEDRSAFAKYKLIVK